jgi:hypothetical protein
MEWLAPRNRTPEQALKGNILCAYSHMLYRQN